MNRDHHEDRKGRDRIPFKRARTEDQPKDRIDNDNDECGGMPCCLPDMGRPVIFDGLDHATSYYKRKHELKCRVGFSTNRAFRSFLGFFTCLFY